MPAARIHIIVQGDVQGVFFRSYVKKTADFLKLSGWARNNPDGSVEVVAEGEKNILQQLLDKCRTGPQLAKVGRVEFYWGRATGEFDGFEVRY